MRKLTFLLLPLLAACTFLRPAFGVENFLQSTYSLNTTGNEELTDLETSITVTSSAEQWFILLTLDVYNMRTHPNQLYVKFTETGAAVADETATFLIPDQDTYRVQLTATYLGSALGLGAHTWKVYAQGNDFTLQTTSSMFIANPLVPSGVLTTLNTLTDAVQTLSYTEACSPAPQWTSASGDHELCIPDAGATINRGLITNDVQNLSGFKDFQSGVTATDAGNGVRIGASASVSGAGGIAVGANASAAGGSICIGEDCAGGAAGECSMGSNSYPCTDYCIGDGCASASPVAVAYRGTNGTGTDIASAETRVYGGRSTGAGACGSVVFGTCTPGGSGSSLNPIVQRWQITSDGDLLPLLDATYDIGSPTKTPANVFGDWVGLPIGEQVGGFGVDMTSEGAGFPMFDNAGFFVENQIPKINRTLRPYDIGVDGTQCTRTDNHQINSGPKIPTITCADHASSAFYGVWTAPDGWDTGNVRFEVHAVNENASPSGVMSWDFSCQCRGDGELISSTWFTAGGDNADITFTTQYDQEQVETGNITCSAGCAVGDTIYWRALLDEPTTTTQMGDVYITAIKFEATLDSVEH